MASIGAGASLTPSSTIATVFPVAEIIAAVDSLTDAMLAQGAIPILIFSIQSGLYAQFPVIRAVVNDSSPDGRLSKSFAAARCLEATQGESSLLELHAGGEPR
jgi:hypothetical protein